LAGYAVECALKACIAKGTQRYDFADKQKVIDSYNHDPHKLAKVAGLESAAQHRADADPDFRKNWARVREWSEQSRYTRHARENAEGLVEAISDRRHGVISWIKLYW
jgi:hypothetical protein